MRWLLVWVINTIALMAIGKLFDGIHVDSWTTGFVAAAVLGLINVTIRPILSFLTLPLQILTLGIVTIALNAFCLIMMSKLVDGFSIDGFGTAFWASIVYSLITWASSSLLLSNDKD